MPKKLLWQLYLSFLLITLLSTLAAGIYASNALKSFYLDQLTAELEDNAQLIIKLLGKSVSEGQESKIDSLAKQIGEDIGKRVTIILPSGLVIGDSDEDPLRMDNHAKRPEILSAIKGDTGSSSRFSRTIGLDMLYVALPIQHDGRLVGVVRISTSMLAITHTLEKAYKRLAWAVLAMLVVTALLSLVLARRISRPIREINRGAERFAAGDLDHRIPKPPIEEMEYLAGTMNKMATQLNERIRTITRQRNELEALLSGMVEAVFMVDRDGLLIWANHAFGELFNTDPIALRNQPIAEIIQHVPLMEFLHTCIRSEEPSETDIILEKKSERFLQAHGRRITDPEGTYTGALVVLNDVTRLKKLERVRQDFVANVSHELKTPITSIIGFVETLRDGAMTNPEKSVEFLGIIARQAERLNAHHQRPADAVSPGTRRAGRLDAVRIDQCRSNRTLRHPNLFRQSPRQRHKHQPHLPRRPERADQCPVGRAGNYQPGG